MDWFKYYGVIYRIVNKINGKSYIGQTINFKRRRKEYKRAEKKPGLYSSIYRSIFKYGFDNFSMYIIDYANDKESLDSKEIFWISFYKSNVKQIGYNIESGGNTPGRVSEETRKKMSEAHKGKCAGPAHYMYGKHLSKEQKEHLSIMNSGTNNFFYGKKLSDETRKKNISIFNW